MNIYFIRGKFQNYPNANSSSFWVMGLVVVLCSSFGLLFSQMSIMSIDYFIIRQTPIKAIFKNKNSHPCPSGNRMPPESPAGVRMANRGCELQRHFSEAGLGSGLPVSQPQERKPPRGSVPTSVPAESTQRAIARSSGEQHRGQRPPCSPCAQSGQPSPFLPLGLYTCYAPYPESSSQVCPAA